MERKAYVQEVRLDPLGQDRLRWAESCLKHLYPEGRFSKSLIMRRALENYTSYLENITTPTGGGKLNYPAVSNEAAHLLNHKSDQRVYWDGGVFPEDSLFDDQGRIIPWRLLHGAAKKAHSDKGRKNLFDREKRGNGGGRHG